MHSFFRSTIHSTKQLLVFASLIAAVLINIVSGAVGNFDRSFGNRGKVTTTFGSASDKITAIALQPDGKIVAAGTTNDFTNVNAAVVRYNADGSLDQSFGEGGKVRLVFPGSHESIHDVKIQSNGKIVIAGYRNIAGDNDFFLARLNSDGTLDDGFGVDGIVVANPGTTADAIKAIALQNIDGEEKIVAAGSMGAGANSNFVVARFNGNGNLDPSFAQGVGMTFVSWGHEDTAEAVAIQRIGNEDKIVLGGKRRLDSGPNGYNDDFALARFNSNGSLDASFGVGGKVNTNFAASDIIRDIVIQPSATGSKIVAGGLGNNNFALARYHENGSLDSSFGTQGKVQTSMSTREDQIHDLFLLADGRILAGGFTRNETLGREDFAVVRYLKDGQIDLLFGNCGPITSKVGSSHAIAYGVAALADGRTIAAGHTLNGENSDDFTLVRFTDNAAAAPTGLDFDGDGRTDTSVFRPSDGTWHINRSCYGYNAVQFGQQGDQPVPADYDGDGKTDIAVFRFGVWYILQSSGGFYATQFGLAEDIPVAGDFDDDGKADIAVYRPPTGTWYINRSSDRQVTSTRWGKMGDLPVAADYDGDFKTDLAVFRPSDGTWYVLRSATNSSDAIPFGRNGDRPLISDFDGDLKADLTVFRIDDRVWYSQRSSLGFSTLQFGLQTDIPVVGDYDGDGRSDHTVYRSGTWYVQQSRFGIKAFQFGLADDIPLTSK